MDSLARLRVRPLPFPIAITITITITITRAPSLWHEDKSAGQKDSDKLDEGRPRCGECNRQRPASPPPLDPRQPGEGLSRRVPLEPSPRSSSPPLPSLFCSPHDDIHISRGVLLPNPNLRDHPSATGSGCFAGSQDARGEPCKACNSRVGPGDCAVT